MKKRRALVLSTMVLILCAMFTGGFDESARVHADEPEENHGEKKEVYLTFDDGPTPGVTERILDVLKEKNAKATFFVVGKEIDQRENVLKRIYDEGHAIGVHTYSHNFKKIYSSEDKFVSENIEAAQKVKEITGYTPTVLRFPGGSSSHLSENLLEKLHENNFKVYDWNCSIEDGVKPYLSSSSLFANAKKVRGDQNRIIILMHCNSNNKTTVEALPEIIDYYRQQGYEVKPITKDTEEFYYRIRKNKQ